MGRPAGTGHGLRRARGGGGTARRCAGRGVRSERRSRSTRRGVGLERRPGAHRSGRGGRGAPGGGRPGRGTPARCRRWSAGTPPSLDEDEIARAVVESLAENLSDAVVATALWGLLGGAPGALAHRAANTLDAMVGHRDARHARFGWAAARLDDVLGWPAARATALLVALAAPGRAGAIWRACRRDAPAASVAQRRAWPRPPLPPRSTCVSGAPIATGPARRPGRRSGPGRRRPRADIGRAIALVRRTTVLLELALAGTWLVARLAARTGARSGAR